MMRFVPQRILWAYQPPYSPEVNPLEQVWAWAKGEVAGEIVETVADLKRRVNAIFEGAGDVAFKSIVHRQFILDALEQAGI